MNKRLILVYVVGLLIGISYGLHGPLLPIFAKNVIGASYAELGIIGFANFIPYMFFPLFVGIFLNRFNNAHLLSIGVVINSASVYLLSISQTVPEIMGFRIITGVAHAFFWPPCEAIISNVSKGKTRVRNIATFTGFFTTGFMIGPLVGSMLLENFDVTYRMIFEIAAYVLVASLVSSLILSKNKPTIKHERFSFSSLKEISRFPQVILMLIYCTASFGIVLSIYPAFLNDRTMTPVDIEILFFIFGISRIITLGVSGKLAKHTSTTLIVATFAIASGLGLSFFVETIIEFAIALILLGFGFSIFFPLTLEIILSKTRQGISGAMIGAYETTFGIGWASGPIIAGFISQFFGNNMPYMIFCVIGIGVAILSISKRRLLEPNQNTNI